MAVKKYVVWLCLLLLSQPLLAHTINYALENSPTNDVIGFYMSLGFRHVVPYGSDHILFITGLCLLNPRISSILWQATIFTLAHSVTLALSMKNMIVAPPALVEPVIALSIAFIAIENLLLNRVTPWRLLVVFAFGLIHGMGFASALNEIGLPRNRFYTSVISFNLGVELGQIAIIVAVFFIFNRLLANKSWSKKFVMYPLSAAIAIIALYWTIQRTFLS